MSQPAGKSDQEASISRTDTPLPRPESDRRAKPTAMLSKYTLFGRRRKNRRDTDPRVAYYIDWIEGPYLKALLCVVLFIAMDAFSTLHIISQGGAEANPLMRWMLELGTIWFLALKAATALVGFLLLAVHRFFPVSRVMVTALLLAYGLLVAYHIFLLFQIHA